MPTENQTVYWCQDCGLRCDTIEVPFIAATLEQPEEGGYFESACCGGETQEEPIHTCKRCGEEHEFIGESELRMMCRLCRFQKAHEDLKFNHNTLNSELVQLHTQTAYRILLGYVQEEIDNFERKELTR